MSLFAVAAPAFAGHHLSHATVFSHNLSQSSSSNQSCANRTPLCVDTGPARFGDAWFGNSNPRDLLIYLLTHRCIALLARSFRRRTYFARSRSAATGQSADDTVDRSVGCKGARGVTLNVPRSRFFPAAWPVLYAEAHRCNGPSFVV